MPTTRERHRLHTGGHKLARQVHAHARGCAHQICHEGAPSYHVNAVSMPTTRRMTSGTPVQYLEAIDRESGRPMRTAHQERTVGANNCRLDDEMNIILFISLGRMVSKMVPSIDTTISPELSFLRFGGSCTWNFTPANRHVALKFIVNIHSKTGNMRFWSIIILDSP